MAFFWKMEIELWVKQHRRISDSLSNDLIRFFGLAFEHARHPEKSWFGTHQQAISLVTGGIFLAAVYLPKRDRGIWLLLDRDVPTSEDIEYKPVKSTQTSTMPLIWAHLQDIEAISSLIEQPEIWQSYSDASDKILHSAIGVGREEIQQQRKKRRLSDFWPAELKGHSESNLPSEPPFGLENFHLLTEPEDRFSLETLEVESKFNPEALEDARQRVLLASVVQRQGQAEFRRQLLAVYDGCCPITGCDAEPALQAAHIIPYQGIDTNHLANGLPLRADIHALFDRHLLSIHPESYKIVLAPELAKTCYRDLAGQALTLPSNEAVLPNQEALTQHYNCFLEQCANNEPAAHQDQKG